MTNIIPMVEEGRILWLIEEPLEDWIENMKKDGTYGDQICLQILANLLERDIVYIPVHERSATIIGQYCLIISDTKETGNIPISLLWFEESEFGIGHYQSIVPNSISSILEHYMRFHSNISMDNRLSRMTLGSVDTAAPDPIPPLSSSMQPDYSKRKICGNNEERR